MLQGLRHAFLSDVCEGILNFGSIHLGLTLLLILHVVLECFEHVDSSPLARCSGRHSRYVFGFLLVRSVIGQEVDLLSHLLDILQGLVRREVVNHVSKGVKPVHEVAFAHLQSPTGCFADVLGERELILERTDPGNPSSEVKGPRFWRLEFRGKLLDAESLKHLHLLQQLLSASELDVLLLFLLLPIFKSKSCIAGRLCWVVRFLAWDH